MTILFLCRKNCKPTSRMRVLSLMVLCFGFSFCLPAHSQTLGRISGIVRDANGGAVSGAMVTVTEVARGIRRTLTTDNTGAYFSPDLIPGTYSVQVTHMGFKAFEVQNILVGVASDVHVDATLQPGQQGEGVTLTAQNPTVITTNARLSSTLSADALNELPLAGHNYVQLLSLFPTLQLRQGSSAGSSQNSDGLRGEFNVYVFDGITDQESYYATSPINSAFPAGGPEEGVILPAGSIREFDIVQNADAPFGWRPGAQINVGTESGTNSVHGAAFGSGLFTPLTAQNFFAVTKPSTTFADYGLSLGGPMKKDKLFFFLGYEGQRYNFGEVTNQDVPSLLSGLGAAASVPDAITAAGNSVDSVLVSLAGCTVGPPPTCTSPGIFGNYTSAVLYPVDFPLFGRTNNGVGRADYVLNRQNNFGAEFFGADGSAVVPFLATEPYWSTPLADHNRVLRAWWTWALNSNWVNDLRFGWDHVVFSSSGNYDCSSGSPGTYDNIDDNAWVSGSTAPNYQSVANFLGGGQPSCAFPTVQINGFAQTANGVTTANLLGGASSTFDTSGVYRVLDTASWIRGKHIVTFGGESVLNRGLISLNAGLNKGALFFGNLTDFMEGAPSFYEIQQGTVPRQFNFGSAAAFVEDHWRVLRRLTLNLGLRYEYTGTITEETFLLGNFDLSNPTGMTQQGQNGPLYRLTPWGFAPRFGLAYDLTGKGTTVVRAGFNIIYQNPTAEVFFGPGMNAVPTGLNLSNGTTLLNEGGTINLQNIATPTPVPSGDIIKSGVSFFGTTLPLASGCTEAAPCSFGASASHLDLPEVLNWNLGVQHAFANNLTLDIEYVGNHGQHLFGVADINQPAPGSTTGEQQRRPLTQFSWLGQIKMVGAIPGWSNYNALQVVATERVTHGLSFLATYAYSHALDTESSELELPQNSTAPAAMEYGNSSFDLRHHVAVGLWYAIPGKPGHHRILEGWQVATIASVFSGRPFGAIDMGDDISGTGELEDRWTLVGSSKDFSDFGSTQGIPCYDANLPGTTSGTWRSACTSASAAPAIWQLCVNAAKAEPNGPAGVPENTGLAQLDRLGCYAMGNSVIIPPAQGTFGTMSRNELYSIGTWEWDASIMKNWPLREKLNAQLRADFFNVTNKTSFAAPASALQSPSNFGQAAATPDATSPFVGTGGPRKIQVGIKLLF